MISKVLPKAQLPSETAVPQPQNELDQIQERNYFQSAPERFFRQKKGDAICISFMTSP